MNIERKNIMVKDFFSYNKKVIKEAYLYEKIKNDKVKCLSCERKCIINNNQYGFCHTKINFSGKLYTIAYGDISAIESRPIEIKPFFHYWPGSTALTFSTWSCNFNCLWCQNYHLSKNFPNPLKSNYISPEEMVNIAIKNNDEGLCVSFQEPTLLLEYSIDVFSIAKKNNLYCCYVSNGYMTLEALKLLKDSGMDGLKIDVKGDYETYEKYCGGVNLDIVWRNAREAKKMGIHIEIVNLIVTNVNDSENQINELIERHLKEVGEDTPIHFTRYYPAYKFHNPPTKIEILEKARDKALRMGIKYAYIGNVPGHPYENTYCPNCGKCVIKRYGYKVLKYDLINGKCPNCGYNIPIFGKYCEK